jgi:hypothetical protein
MSEMKPYDAVFLAVAVGLFLTRPRWWWLAALAPAVALAAHWMPLGRFATPVAAIAACVLVPRYAPVALVLAIPIYQDPLDVLRAALLWLAVSALMEGLEDRFVDEILPSRVRRMSARLLSVAVLYYTLLPVMFL